MGFVTVTRVAVTPDLRKATVFYTVLGEDTGPPQHRARACGRALAPARGARPPGSDEVHAGARVPGGRGLAQVERVTQLLRQDRRPRSARERGPTGRSRRRRRRRHASLDLTRHAAGRRHPPRRGRRGRAGLPREPRPRRRWARCSDCRPFLAVPRREGRCARGATCRSCTPGGWPSCWVGAAFLVDAEGVPHGARGDGGVRHAPRPIASGLLAANARRPPSWIVLDHHRTNPGFGLGSGRSTPQASSTAEMVYRLIERMGGDLRPPRRPSACTPGCSRTPGGSSTRRPPRRRFALAAALREFAFDHARLRAALFEDGVLPYLRVLGPRSTGWCTTRRSSLVWTYLTQADLAAAGWGWRRRTTSSTWFERRGRPTWPACSSSSATGGSR